MGLGGQHLVAADDVVDAVDAGRGLGGGPEGIVAGVELDRREVDVGGQVLDAGDVDVVGQVELAVQDGADAARVGQLGRPPAVAAGAVKAAPLAVAARLLLDEGEELAARAGALNGAHLAPGKGAGRIALGRLADPDEEHVVRVAGIGPVDSRVELALVVYPQVDVHGGVAVLGARAAPHLYRRGGPGIGEDRQVAGDADGLGLGDVEVVYDHRVGGGAGGGEPDDALEVIQGGAGGAGQGGGQLDPARGVGAGGAVVLLEHALGRVLAAQADINAGLGAVVVVSPEVGRVGGAALHPRPEPAGGEIGEGAENGALGVAGLAQPGRGGP